MIQEIRSIDDIDNSNGSIPVFDYVQTVEDYDKYEGAYLVQKMNNFFEAFSKMFGDNDVIVHSMVHSAFMIAGKDTSNLIVDPHMGEE